ncbi:UNVERIFIED_CONTAM: hypothetical protein OHV15_14560 [Microbacterium sp. SLM126]
MRTVRERFEAAFAQAVGMDRRASALTRLTDAQLDQRRAQLASAVRWFADATLEQQRASALEAQSKDRRRGQHHRSPAQVGYSPNAGARMLAGSRTQIFALTEPLSLVPTAESGGISIGDRFAAAMSRFRFRLASEPSWPGTAVVRCR